MVLIRVCPNEITTNKTKEFLEPVAVHVADLMDAADKKTIKRTKLSSHV